MACGKLVCGEVVREVVEDVGDIVGEFMFILES
jgi:hypothetical protein